MVEVVAGGGYVFCPVTPAELVIGRNVSPGAAEPMACRLSERADRMSRRVCTRGEVMYEVKRGRGWCLERDDGEATLAKLLRGDGLAQCPIITPHRNQIATARQASSEGRSELLFSAVAELIVDITTALGLHVISLSKIKVKGHLRPNAFMKQHTYRSIL